MDRRLITYFLSRYGLVNYCREDANNGRITRINISEEDFREWLLSHRAAVAAAAAAGAEEDDGWHN